MDKVRIRRHLTIVLLVFMLAMYTFTIVLAFTGPAMAFFGMMGLSGTFSIILYFLMIWQKRLNEIAREAKEGVKENEDSKKASLEDEALIDAFEDEDNDN